MSDNKAKISDSLKKKAAPKNFNKKPIKGTRFTVMISSAKGGVGKSTFAINIAFALWSMIISVVISNNHDSYNL